ncbi:MAG: methyltransferase domain-containing protein [Rhodospirillales bacterium]|nr:methyltransferase domain-containing protein [Rhodospirillales bacterium]
MSARSRLPEAMDAPELDEAVYQRCLADLAKVNRVTLTHQASLRWLDAATRNLPRGSRISVLDVAYGQGDLLRRIARWAKKRGFDAQLAGVDLNPRSAIAARAATTEDQQIAYYTADVFAFTPDAGTDYIVTSQFTHHLETPQIIQLLRWLETHAERGWHIADLHRHAFAYHGFPLLARLMQWHPIVRSDGQISIARGFTREEWVALLQQAHVQARIAWHPLFRHSVSRLK